MNPKELKKLAAVCRKAGIRHYKCADFEFTLTEDEPQVKSMRIPTQKDTAPDTKIQSDGLTQEELLFWSTNPEVTDSEQV